MRPVPTGGDRVLERSDPGRGQGPVPVFCVIAGLLGRAWGKYAQGSPDPIEQDRHEVKLGMGQRAELGCPKHDSLITALALTGLPQGVGGDRMVDEEEQFECPECGKLFGVGTMTCPGCGMAFEWDEEETEEALDELIEQVEKAEDVETEPPYDPSPGPVDEVTEPPYDPSPGPEVVAAAASDEVTEPPYDLSTEPEVVATATSYEEIEMPMEEAPMALEEPPVAKKKALSMLGIAFAVLAVVSVIGLMVVLNYDTWIKGDAENHIGDTQIIYVYMAVAAVVVCILVVVFDFVRNRKAV